MPKPKGKNFPPVRVTEELFNQAVKNAELANEYLSDYIRKAVEMRIGQKHSGTEIKALKSPIKEANSTIKIPQKSQDFHPCPK